MKTTIQNQVIKYSFFLLLIFNSCSIKAQNLFTNFYFGAANYKGDLGSAKFPLSNSHPAFGLGFSYEINNRMAVSADVFFAKISGSDKYGGPNKARNLSFTSNITEFSISFQYTLFDLYQYKVSPYFFTGIGRFAFDPFTKNKNGQTVNLAELDTEGEGFYKGRKHYNTKQTCIPFGGGITWALNDDKRLSFSVGIRKTFTDYLDDVSTTYVDANLLTANRGSTATMMAYRGGELPNGAPYPADGTQRGNPKSKDWYYFSGLSFQMRLMPPHANRAYNGKLKKAKTTCPRVF